MFMLGSSELCPANFSKHGDRAAACHANFACCGQPLQNFLASPHKSAVSPSRLPLSGVGENKPADNLTYILDCDLTYTAPSGHLSLGSHATSCRNRAEPGVSHADLQASSTSSSSHSTSTPTTHLAQLSMTTTSDLQLSLLPATPHPISTPGIGATIPPSRA
jgi:hypothetical protein